MSDLYFGCLTRLVRPAFCSVDERGQTGSRAAKIDSEPMYAWEEPGKNICLPQEKVEEGKKSK